MTTPKRKKKPTFDWDEFDKNLIVRKRKKKHVHKYDRCFLGLKKGKHKGCRLTNIMCKCGKVRHEKNS